MSCRYATLPLVALLSLVLADCSVFPGMTYNAPVPDEGTNLSSETYQGSQPVQAGGPGMPAYSIESITPELLVAQAAARSRAAVGKTGLDLSKQIAGYTYRIGISDVLAIVVWGDTGQTSQFQPSGSAAMLGAPVASAGASSTQNAVGNGNGAAGFKVGSDGTIFYPYVGRLSVAGKRLEDVRVEITSRLRAFLKDPQVTVDIAQFNSQKYQLAGAVMKPGLYSVTDQPLTVSQAIATAGGVVNQVPNTITFGATVPRPLADLSHVRYIHNGKTCFLNLRAFYLDGDAGEDRLVSAGDVIQVPDNSFEQIHVIGEVKSPGEYPLDNGDINLAEVLGQAGGVDPLAANPSRIFVFRGAYQEPHVFWLDARSPDSMLLATHFELQPQDVVYVGTAGLTTWNRVVTQILPTIESIYETKVLVSP